MYDEITGERTPDNSGLLKVILLAALVMLAYVFLLLVLK
jgi:hypothetical protein